MDNLSKEIIANIGEGLCILDLDENFIFSNEILGEMFGISSEELITKSLKDFVNEQEWNKIQENTEARKNGKITSFEIKIFIDNKEEKIFQFTGSPNYDKNKTIKNTIGVFRDITKVTNELNELKIINDENEELSQELFTQTLQADILKKKAEKYSKQLKQGINFAKTVQDSLMPSEEDLKNKLSEDLFILYKPKHVIGGDFYYLKEKDGLIIVAVADCTGHGVSGALISMLGITFLDDVIEKSKELNSGKILGNLRDRIKSTFISYGDSIQNKNGMDITFCIIDKKNNTLQYSGAYNSLFIIRNEVLLEYKATKNPIAFYPVEKEFETTDISLQKGDCVYLFSDGFHDQLGGDSFLEKKYSKKRFKDFLLQIYKNDFTKQKLALDEELIRWIGNYEQIDDVTILGMEWNS